LAGVSVALGYFPIFVGVAVFYNLAGFSYPPRLTSRLFLAGLVYPVVFGGFGGLTAYLYRVGRPGIR